MMIRKCLYDTRPKELSCDSSGEKGRGSDAQGLTYPTSTLKGKSFFSGSSTFEVFRVIRQVLFCPRL